MRLPTTDETAKVVPRERVPEADQEEKESVDTDTAPSTIEYPENRVVNPAIFGWQVIVSWMKQAIWLPIHLLFLRGQHGWDRFSH